MKVALLTEGSAHIGFGHLTRCRALWEAFDETAIEADFLIEGNESVHRILPDIPFELVHWHEFLPSIIERTASYDVLIIDSYHVDEHAAQAFASAVRLPVFIDDYARIPYPAGIVINGGIHAADLNYPAIPKVTYLRGPRYLPIRKPFWDIPEKTIHHDIASVMLTFGGDDMRHLTPGVLQWLTKSAPHLQKHVIIGPEYQNVAAIRKEADAQTTFHLYPDGDKMKEIMMASDLAISAAGQTLYELARTGTPTIALGIADNQRGNIKGWGKIGFIEFAGWWDEPHLLAHLNKAFERLQPMNVRQQRSVIGRHAIDGQGARRVVQFILDKMADKASSN